MDGAATPIEVGPGTVLGGTYLLEDELGRGGMGLVFAGRHTRTHKRVAIKFLLETLDPEHVARFRQEAEVASRIGHPNIIKVLDFDTLPSGTTYIVMEYLEGESLAARLRRGRLGVSAALPILRQIASALHAAHGAGVIHRDLKPDNVFLIPRERDGVAVDHVKVLDFGVSKVLGSTLVRTRNDVALGTPRYMAPEQAAGRNDELDGRTDQFALAVIAFEMLAGEAPFEGDNGTQVMFKIVNEPSRPLAPLVPAAPPQVIAAIERAMSKRPQERFRDLSAFMRALTGEPLVHGEVEAPEPLEAVTVNVKGGALKPATAPVRSAAAPVVRSPGLALWLAIGVALLGGGIVAFVAHDRHAREPASVANAESPVVRTSDAAAPLIMDAAVVAVVPDAAVPDAVVTDAATPSDAAPRVRPRVTGDPAAPPLEPGAVAALADAEAALRAGDLAKAATEAKHAIGFGPNPRAYQVLLEVACRNHDVAEAHVALRNLSTRGKAVGRARCQAVGFPVDPEP